MNEKKIILADDEAAPEALALPNMLADVAGLPRRPGGGAKEPLEAATGEGVPSAPRGPIEAEVKQGAPTISWHNNQTDTQRQLSMNSVHDAHSVH